IFMGILAVAAAVFIREPAESAKGNGSKGGPWNDIGLVAKSARLRLPIIGLFLSQTAYIVSLTLLALQIQQLSRAGTNVDAIVGLVLTVNAVGMAVGATVFGWFSDKIGATRSVIISFVLASAAAFIQAMLTDPNHFVLVRALA